MVRPGHFSKFCAFSIQLSIYAYTNKSSLLYGRSQKGEFVTLGSIYWRHFCIYHLEIKLISWEKYKKRKNFAFLEKSSFRRRLKLCWVLASKEVQTCIVRWIIYSIPWTHPLFSDLLVCPLCFIIIRVFVCLLIHCIHRLRFGAYYCLHNVVMLPGYPPLMKD
jgi:hypothetical protein